MPPRQPPAEPQAPPAPPAGDQPGGSGKPVDDRLSALEQHSEKQDATLQQHGGMLQQILDRLPGKTPSSGPAPTPAATDPDEGKPIAVLVREGVEKLEAEKAAKAQKDTETAERANHAERIRKLEEAKPREVAATPAGRVRAAVQRYGFGITDTRR